MKRVTNYVDEAHNEVPKSLAAFVHEAVYDNTGKLVSDSWRQLNSRDLPVPVVKPVPIKPHKP
jgi:hypothetical protein